MEYQKLEFNELSEEMLSQLQKGAFMTTKADGVVNTMTIAWGGINFVWHRKVFVAYVRYTRHTYKMLEQGDNFTISVPLNKDLKKELSFCGTKSGRDYDKIKECNFTLIPSKKVETPIIGECELHYECKVIYKQAMEPNSIPPDVKKGFYSNNNYHVIYYGEILESYLLKGDK